MTSFEDRMSDFKPKPEEGPTENNRWDDAVFEPVPEKPIDLSEFSDEEDPEGQPQES